MTTSPNPNRTFQFAMTLGNALSREDVPVHNKYISPLLDVSSTEEIIGKCYDLLLIYYVISDDVRANLSGLSPCQMGILIQTAAIDRPYHHPLSKGERPSLAVPTPQGTAEEIATDWEDWLKWAAVMRARPPERAYQRLVDVAARGDIQEAQTCFAQWPGLAEKGGYSALMDAVEWGQVDFIRWLFSVKDCVPDHEEWLRAALCRACGEIMMGASERDRIAVIEALADLGAKVKRVHADTASENQIYAVSDSILVLLKNKRPDPASLKPGQIITVDGEIALFTAERKKMKSWILTNIEGGAYPGSVSQQEIYDRYTSFERQINGG